MKELEPPPWKKKEFLGGVAFLMMVFVAVWLFAMAVYDWLLDEQKVPLKQVQVSGELTWLLPQDIEAAIRQNQPHSLFGINVDQAHADIEELPWVYQASIRKSWPDTLKVYVIEQEAVARWNQDLLLNRFGGIFNADFTGEKLPLLFGPGGSELTVLEGFKAMQGLLQNSGLVIDELSLSERYAWNLELHNGVSLRLGRTEFMDRLQRFIDVYPLLLKHDKSVSYVDLRYDTGLAVGWL